MKSRKLVVFSLLLLSIFSIVMVLAQEPNIVYGKVIEAPEYIYRSPTQDADRYENTLVFDTALTVMARHKYLDVGAILRLELIDDTWAKIMPEEGLGVNEQPYPSTAYIKLSEVELLDDQDFSAFSVYSDTKQVDKLIVVETSQNPKIVLFEGQKVVGIFPTYLGPTPHGDFRVYYTRASDNMPGLPGVPWVNYFTGGYALHGTFWWNWSNIGYGGYGSHGCVNLPDDNWYRIQVGDHFESVSQWVYRWISTNINYDEGDPYTQYGNIKSTDPAWYQAKGSVRVIVVDDIHEIYNYAPTTRLGNIAASSQISDWAPLLEDYDRKGNNWYLSNMDSDGTLESQLIKHGETLNHELSEVDQAFVMLTCDDPATYNDPAYEGSTRTIGTVCHHLRVERAGSICSPERVDLDYFGKKVLCDGTKFLSLHIYLKGELIEHEKIHFEQFQGYFKELAIQGVAADDLTYSGIDPMQISSIGITELAAQLVNQDSVLNNDYRFVLVTNRSGSPKMIPALVTAEEAWQHLIRECTGEMTEEEAIPILQRGLMGDKESYIKLTEICSLPPHRLVPDRVRVGH